MASELVERLRDFNEVRNWPLLSTAARRIEALEEFVRLVLATPDPDARKEDDIDELYANERRLAGLRRAASALEGK